MEAARFGLRKPPATENSLSTAALPGLIAKTCSRSFDSGECCTNYKRQR